MKPLLALLLFLFSLDAGAASYTLATPPVHVPITIQNRLLAKITAVQQAWANLPYRTGTVHYYCDCGTNAEADCVVGNNANSGLTTALPRRTLAQAVTDFASLSSGDTIALCKGGAFDAIGDTTLGSSGRCAAGSACNDFREFAPTTFTGTAKPLINYSGSGNAIAISAYSTEKSGIRILNLHIKGVGSGVGIFTYNNGPHTPNKDMVIGNVTIEFFNNGIQTESSGSLGSVNNVQMTGNTLIDNVSMALQGASDNSSFSYNYLLNNGNNAIGNHSIYISADSPLGEAVNYDIIGNYVYGQSSATCVGGSVIGHGNINGLNVKDNWIEIADADTTPGCWGLSFNNQDAYPSGEYFRNAVFSGNVVINGGNLGFNVSVCPSCIIENNIVVFNTITTDTTGMRIPTLAAGTSPADDVNTANTVRNNTVYFGPGTTSYTKTGIEFGTEGTSHISANNTVYYGGTSGSIRCFNYTLAVSAYTFIDNNHCYSASSSYTWDVLHGATLAAWRTYSGKDTNSLVNSNPLFTSASTYNFTPGAGSPLIGAGSNANKSTLDFLRKTRPNPPAIGAFEP